MNIQIKILLYLSIFFTFTTCEFQRQKYQILKPEIQGDWWQIAGNPDLEKLSSVEQQPVGFGIWQAKDNTWQLCSRIRKTKEAGNTRRFHRWEGKSLFDSH